jgi:hypothetical protein
MILILRTSLWLLIFSHLIRPCQEKRIVPPPAEYFLNFFIAVFRRFDIIGSVFLPDPFPKNKARFARTAGVPDRWSARVYCIRDLNKSSILLSVSKELAEGEPLIHNFEMELAKK